MITAKCPLRISLVGGSTDLESFIQKYKKGSVINFTPNLYTYISISKNQPQNQNYRINYSNTENVKKTSDIKNDIAREVINHFKLPPITMLFNSDIPTSGSGLASSSSYMIAAIAASLKFLNIKWSQFKICTLALKLERKFNPLTGYQDPYGCGIGGLKRFNFYGGDNIDIKYLNTDLIDMFNIELMPTFLQRSSTNILSTININKSKLLLKDVEKFENILQGIVFTKEPLYTHKKEVCNIINKAWINKKNTSTLVTNQEIKDIDNKLSNNKDIKAYKLLGAGGGGYFLNLMDTKSNLKNNIPISIDYEGVTVKEFG